MADRQTRIKPSPRVTAAMLLAAGLGARLRPLTDALPKPLLRVGGKTLLEHGLDMLAAAKVEKVIINCHYLAEKLRDFVRACQARYPMRLIISDESDKLLDSAGGIIKALPLLGQEPFFVLNADTFWREAPGAEPNFRRLAEAFDPEKQDMLLLTALRAQALTPQKGDFLPDIYHRLRRADKSGGNPAAVIYAGGLIVRPAVFAGAESGAPQSLNSYFDRAIAAGRLYGLPLRAEWLSIGTEAELKQAEAALRKRSGRQAKSPCP